MPRSLSSKRSVNREGPTAIHPLTRMRNPLCFTILVLVAALCAPMASAEPAPAVSNGLDSGEFYFCQLERIRVCFKRPWEPSEFGDTLEFVRNYIGVRYILEFGGGVEITVSVNRSIH